MSDCPHPYELQSLVDGALSPEEASRLCAHCLLCPTCGAQVADLERVHWLLREREVDVPASLLQRILQLLASVLPVRKIGCAEALEMASAYIDDELNQLERETLEAHLFACDTCYVEYVSMRTAAHAMREAPAVPVSDGLKSRILAAVAAEAVEEAAPALILRPAFILPPVMRRAWAPAMAVAAVALLSFGVFHVLGGRSAATATGPEGPAAVVASVPAAPVSPDTTATTVTPGPVPAPGAAAAPVPGAPATNAANPAAGSAPGIGTYETIPEIRVSDIRGASGPLPTLPRVSTPSAPRPPTTPSTPARRTTVVTPPSEHTTPAPAPGLSTAERTAAARHNYRPDGFRVPAPPAMDTGSVGVIARRSLSNGESATRLTSVDDLEDTPSERLESRNWVRAAPPAETVYRNSGASNSHLAAMSERINRTAGTERKLSAVSETLGTN